jgi:hypothetical protein
MPIAARKKKDPAAVALGRKGGKKGGPSRAASMTPAQRSESARKAVQARWDKLKTKRRTGNEFVVEPQSDGLFEIANISPKRTGLPFVVWISPRA